MRLAPGEVLSALAAAPTDGSPAAFIVWQARVPQIAVALLAGASLSAAGLVMQTLFANPLADPSLLGVNSGASLGAALVLLCGGGALISSGGMIAGFTLTLAAAFLGAMAVMLVLLALSSMLRGNSQGVRSFVIWGLGDFSGVPLGNLPLYAVPVLLTLFALLFLAKPLNALLLGTEYAHNLGYRVRTVRTLGLLAAGLLAAASTAVCGPVSFIGLAVPHIVRLLYRRADHRLLIPAAMLWGGNVALFALLLTRLPGERGALPLAAVTPLIGVPVVFYILTKKGLRG